MITYARRTNQLSEWSIPKPAFSEHKHIISEEFGASNLRINIFFFFLKGLFSSQ